MSRFIRSKHDADNPYTTINNNVFRDPELSWKAKGFMGYLLTLPENWELLHKVIIKNFRTTRHELDAIIKELINAGYVRRTRVKEGTKFTGYDYEFSENKNMFTEPNSNTGFLRLNPLGKPFPHYGFSQCCSSAAENQHIRKNDDEEVTIKEVKKTSRDCGNVHKPPPKEKFNKAAYKHSPQPGSSSTKEDQTADSSASPEASKKILDGIEYFMKTCPPNDGLKLKTLSRWLKSYPPIEIYEAIMDYKRAKKKKLILRMEAYLEESLKKGYWKINKEREEWKQSTSKKASNKKYYK